MADVAVVRAALPETGRRDEAGGRRSGGLLNPTSIFFVSLLLTGSGVVSAPVALVGGVVFGFAVEHPMRAEAGSLAKLLLQASVVLLGFGIDLREVLRVGRSGFLYTAVSIAVAAVLGLGLGKVLRVGGKASLLITMGTAICGGSAIAALAPIVAADEEEISVSMGTVFLLNSVALLVFPAVGWAMHLSQSQFGLWAALAIHDTSSVVGAAERYGPGALAVGTTVKLARSLWIVPVSLVVAFARRRGTGDGAGGGANGRARVTVPWFILLFLLASVARMWMGRVPAVPAQLTHLGRLGLTATLFLIGTSLSKKASRQVGVRPLVQGGLLWVVVGCASLLLIVWRVIAV